MWGQRDGTPIIRAATQELREMLADALHAEAEREAEASDGVWGVLSRSDPYWGNRAGVIIDALTQEDT